jgi:glucosylglycerate hydrolase
VPHIVFDPRVPDYWPGPEFWASAASTELAPRAPATSGLIQPPMHAIAVWRILESTVGPERFHPRLARLYPKLLAWHRYLAECRDPEGTGLITVYHPWEGTDNTPRWDAALLRLPVGEELAPYIRTDTSLVDADERPTRAEYDRYIWLVDLLRGARYDDETIQRAHPFLIKDVQCSAIFAAACGSLERIAEFVGAEAAERVEISAWRERSAAAVIRSWDDELGVVLDFDQRTDAPIRVSTSAGLGVLLLPGLDPAIADRARRTAFGPNFAGGAGLAYPVILSTALRSPEFRPRAYWRGPAWPVVNWLLWWGLAEQGMIEPAADLRRANLALLSRPAAGFAEYFEPFTGEPLGSLDQSWTAAVALDWLSSQTGSDEVRTA